MAMNITYTIYEIKEIEVHVPSTDFYARGNEPMNETIRILSPVDEYDTEKEAEEYLFNMDKKYGERYTILKTYI